MSYLKGFKIMHEPIYRTICPRYIRTLCVIICCLSLVNAIQAQEETQVKENNVLSNETIVIVGEFEPVITNGKKLIINPYFIT